MAENKLRSFTDADMEALREATRKSRTHVHNPRLRPNPRPEDPFTPEVYVAYTPSGGIPAGNDTVPGNADCTIYRATTDDDTPVLEEADTYDRQINNLGPGVPGSTFVLVVKDKWGTWWVVNGGGDATFLAVLTKCDYPDGPDGRRQYSWWEVFPDPDAPGTYTLGTRNGCPGSNPAYHERNLEVAVVEAGDAGTAGTGSGTGTAVDPTTGCTVPAYIHPLSVFRLRQVSVQSGTGTGTANDSYCLFSGHPMIDLARDTGTPDGPGDAAYIWFRDQNDLVWKDGMYCILIPPE